MEAAAFLLLAAAAAGSGPFRASIPVPSPMPTTRTYYVAADEVEWDYAPSGRNEITGLALGGPEAFWTAPGPHRVGRVYRKAIYREYTDSTFLREEPRRPEWEHLGFLGPLLRAAVGDTIRVVFRNRASFPASLHPHGVFYDKASEGAGSADGTAKEERADDAVPPGGTYTYIWPVPDRAGPADGDPSSILWMYHSHVNEPRDVNAGLMGPIIVTAREAARADATPADVDREFVVSFHEVNENASWYLEENNRRYAGDPDGIEIGFPAFVDSLGASNIMQSMNGYVYGNLPGLEMWAGERVRWYLMSSTNFEIHAPHWHGNTVVAERMRTDVAALLPMGMLVADMVPDNPGTWLFHCHVDLHLVAGMQAHYTVLPAASGEGSSSGG